MADEKIPYDYGADIGLPPPKMLFGQPQEPIMWAVQLEQDDYNEAMRRLREYRKGKKDD